MSEENGQTDTTEDCRRASLWTHNTSNLEAEDTPVTLLSAKNSKMRL